MIIALNQVVAFIELLSAGNSILKITLYVVFTAVLLKVLIVPMFLYLSTPTREKLSEMLRGNSKLDGMIVKHYKNLLAEEKRAELEALDKADREVLVTWIRTYNVNLAKKMDSIIRQYAFRTTAAVLISPNAFLDGLAIIYGNIKMTQQLVELTGFRPTTKEFVRIYGSIFTVASFTGLIEEFDEAFEELVESFTEEFAEHLEAKTGETIGGSIPMVSVLVKTISPLFQAAGNYAFLNYQGNRFKLGFLSTISETPETDESIQKTARKAARRSRFLFMETMLKKLGKGGMDQLKLSKLWGKK